VALCRVDSGCGGGCGVHGGGPDCNRCGACGSGGAGRYCGGARTIGGGAIGLCATSSPVAICPVQHCKL
jgi:hypothetical protein